VSFTYKYPRPALTVDIVVFGFDGGVLKVLLIKRKLEPYKDRWALPGGFVSIDETLDQAALRELKEETGLRNVFLEQLFTFGTLERDPRERVVSVAYYALVKLGKHNVVADSDAKETAWFAVKELPKLAFDHKEILGTALTRLKGKVRYQPIGFELLPPTFTLSQLQQLYETVLERSLDKRNFRKKVFTMNLLRETDEVESGVSHRAARLYAFDLQQYHRLVQQGFNFEI